MLGRYFLWTLRSNTGQELRDQSSLAFCTRRARRSASPACLFRSLSGAGRVIGDGFPASYFQQISVGAFTKGLGLPELWVNHLALAGFTVLFIAVAAIILRKQEA